jgi:hypothetical protein
MAGCNAMACETLALAVGRAAASPRAHSRTHTHAHAHTSTHPHTRAADMKEVAKLSGLSQIEDLLLVGNPLYNDAKDGGTIDQVSTRVWQRERNKDTAT